MASYASADDLFRPEALATQVSAAHACHQIRQIRAGANRFRRISARIRYEFAVATAEIEPPSREAVLTALWSLRKARALTDATVEERYTLLHLPFLVDVPFAERARRFIEALEYVVEQLPAPDAAMTRCSYLDQDQGKIGDRRRAVLDRLRPQFPDWAEQYSDETLELRATKRLVTELLSESFTARITAELGILPPPLKAPNDQDEKGYRWSSASQRVVIKADAPTRQLWTHSFDCVVTRDAVRMFYFDYQWTGGSDEDPQARLLPPYGAQKHLGIHREQQWSSTWNVHLIHLGRMYSRGDEFQVRFTNLTVDQSRSFTPFNALLANHPDLKRLSFECDLPDVPGLRAYAAIWDRSVEPPRRRDIEELERDPDGLFRHTFSSLSPGAAYGISWVDLYDLLDL
jgi:hypothetical protein